MKTIMTIGNLELCYEVFGSENAPAIMLLSGLGSQMIRWEQAYCESWVAKGFRVIRFDNRDVGETQFKTDKELVVNKPITEFFATITQEDIPYTLKDMAGDAIALLDHLKIEKAHLIGRSMGGMIAQLIAAHYPTRVISLAIIMSTSMRPGLPAGDARVMQMLMQPRTHPNENKEAYFTESIAFAKLISGGVYLPDETAECALLEAERTLIHYLSLKYT